jgi:hypothetical protein
MNSLDALVDELVDEETESYRQPHRRPYMRIVHELQRAEARLAAAQAAYRRATSPYTPQQDLVHVNRVIREYQQAQGEVQALRRERDNAAQRLTPRLTRLRQRNPQWPRPISIAQRLRNLLGRR